MTADQEARLECLKVAHRPDKTTEQVLETARAYALYVIGAGNSQEPADSNGKDRRPRRA